MIEQIITLLRKETGYKYYFNAASKIEDCIVYNYTDTSNDGIKKEYKLQLTIIVKGITEKSLLNVEKIKKKINDTLITRADNQLTEKILSVYQNGGGQLIDYNTSTVHQILYYDIVLK